MAKHHQINQSPDEQTINHHTPNMNSAQRFRLMVQLQENAKKGLYQPGSTLWHYYRYRLKELKKWTQQ